jgi:hypothetical protein
MGQWTSVAVLESTSHDAVTAVGRTRGMDGPPGESEPGMVTAQNNGKRRNLVHSIHGPITGKIQRVV